MKRKSVLLILPLMLVMLMSSMSWGQRIEFMPFAGYRTSGTFNVDSELFSTFKIEDGFNYGLTLGFMVTPETEVEFMWSLTNSRLSGSFLQVGQNKNIFFDMHTNMFHINFLYLYPYANERIVPYFLIGLGLTYADPKDGTNGETRFSFSVGGGLKIMASQRVGLRFQAKWTPTYINSHSELWNYWGYLYFVPVSQYMHQGEFTGGIFFRF